jgi:hypothetical protein
MKLQITTLKNTVQEHQCLPRDSDTSRVGQAIAFLTYTVNAELNHFSNFSYFTQCLYFNAEVGWLDSA